MSDQPAIHSTFDPVAAFFADPGSHLSDILYLYFRHYKRELLYRFFMDAVAALKLSVDSSLRVADVGASMGYDLQYLFTRLTADEPQRLPLNNTFVTLVEGDDYLLSAGRSSWANFGDRIGVSHEYVKCDLAGGLRLPDVSQHIILCSEVVEHLERPDRLLRDIHSALRPNGFLILTTDNSPSWFQRLRRIPIWLAGEYGLRYKQPEGANEIASEVVVGDTRKPIYGHIHLRPTRYWERLVKKAGFRIHSLGTYESIRRGGGSRTPFMLAAYFGMGFLVSTLPRRFGRFFGDTTALMLRKL